ncbi:MAG TPA: plasmid pRiA4b ORF-3 family protein, partial [Methylophilus sp.]
PQVWRRVQVAATTTIADLHAIIQTAMGWEDAHLHQFLIYGKAYGVYHDGGFSFADDPDQVRLADFRLRVGERFRYEG